MTGAIRKTVTGIPTRVEHAFFLLFAHSSQLRTAFRLGSAEQGSCGLRKTPKCGLPCPCTTLPPQSEGGQKNLHGVVLSIPRRTSTWRYSQSM